VTDASFNVGGDPLRPASPRPRSPRGIATLPHVDDTVALGAQLGSQLRAGDVVVLSGPLGAGKTVLAKGIAMVMDVDVYRLLDHTGADLLDELESLDLDTELDGAVVVVEWGEGLAERLSDRHLDVRLERISNSDTRTATWQWSCP
jgi:tRNA threonylcarbamoyladenosine biosynthesis protein TsaE